MVDGIPYFLSLTDTAGQEEYRGLWASSNLKSDAFLLVYDITNAASLEALNYFMEMIDIEAEQRLEDNQRLMRELGPGAAEVDVGMPPPVKIIAGNKCDLKDARVIPARQGLDYARGHGCGFMETSAREMVNIEETFACMMCPLHCSLPFIFLLSIHFSKAPFLPPSRGREKNHVSNHST
jgi:GTPase KRas